MPNSQLPVPTESQEAQVLVAWLRLRGLWFFHIPNETGHDAAARRRAIRVKREGGSKGVCDYIVLIRPDQSRYGEGWVVAVELKRSKKSLSRVSPEQKIWIDRFNSVNPRTAGVISYGAEAAIAQLQELMVREAA